MKFTTLTILVYFILQSFYGFTQISPVINFDNTVYNGGLQNWEIVQEGNGNIYVANDQGVLVYNGFNWRTIKIPKHIIVRSLCIVEDKLFIGGFEMFGYIPLGDIQNEEFVPIAKELLEGSNQEIWHIFQDKETIYFQSFSHVFQWNDKEVTPLKLSSNVMFGESINNQTLFPKVRKGLLQLKRDSLVNFETFPSFPDQSKITGLVSYKEDILVSTREYGLFFLSTSNQLTSWDSPINEELKDYHINKILKLKNGHFVIGTLSNGIYILNQELKLISQFNKSNALGNNTVLSLLEDENNNLWVALDQGIDLIAINTPIKIYKDEDGKIGTIFSALEYDNEIYFASNLGVFNIVDEPTVINSSEGLSWKVYQQNKKLFFGHNNGTFSIDKNKKVRKVSSIPGAWDMARIDEYNFLISTYLGVFHVYLNGDTFEEKLVSQSNVLFEKMILSKDLLIGYHKHHGIKSYRFENNMVDYHSEKLISTHVHPNNVTFLSSENANYIFDGQTVYKVSNGEIKKMELSEVKDSAIKMELNWIANGLKFIQKYTNTSTFKWLFSNDDFIYFSIDNGYVKIKKNEALPISKSIFYIDNISFNDSITSIKDGYISLPANSRNIKIQIAKTPISDFQVGLYYKLSNWHSDWGKLPENGKIEIPLLQDGHYELMIKKGKEESKILSLSVSPHWYECKLAYGIYFAILASFLYFGYKRIQKTHELKLERVNLENNQKIEAQKIKLEKEKLQQELIHKSKLLANSTLTLTQKNKMLEDLKSSLYDLDNEEDNHPQIKKRLEKLINHNLSQDQDWKIFEKNFNDVHKDFLDTLRSKHPNLSPKEKRLAAFIKMNLSSKEIAPLLFISYRSVENNRHRLRKKLGLDRNVNLTKYINSL